MGFPVDIKTISFSQVFDDGSMLVAISASDNVRHIFRIGYNQLLLMNNATSSALEKMKWNDTVAFNG